MFGPDPAVLDEKAHEVPYVLRIRVSGLGPRVRGLELNLWVLLAPGAIKVSCLRLHVMICVLMGGVANIRFGGILSHLLFGGPKSVPKRV